MNRMQQLAGDARKTAKPVLIHVWSAVRASVLLISISASVSGQLTITNPDNAEQVNVQSSDHLKTPANQSIGTASFDRRHQVHVTTIKLLVDEETRNSIYQDVGKPGFAVQTSIDPPPALIDLADLEMAKIGNLVQSTVTVRAPTTCALAVIDRIVSDRIVSRISQANPMSIKRSPAIRLINGNVAEMNDVTERPFAIGYHASKTSGTVETFQEGTKIRMLAITGTDSIRFTAQIISSRITSVEKVKVPRISLDQGASDSALDRETVVRTSLVQAPVQQTRSIVVSTDLAPAQCLLVDPSITDSFTTTEESPTPMFGKLPYIGKNFSSSTSVQVDRHVLFLMVPSAIGSAVGE
jgi:hypothetical protein